MVPREKALSYVDRAYDFLESFGLGFDRNDRSTWKPENMPHFYKGGLFVNYGSGHEQFIWDIKWVYCSSAGVLVVACKGQGEGQDKGQRRTCLIL